MKFTFKTNKATGRYKFFSKDEHLIKFNKCKVGYIEDETWHIRLSVDKLDINEDGNINCSWKWVKLIPADVRINSLDEAKKFLNGNIEKIVEKYKLRSLEY